MTALADEVVNGNVDLSTLTQNEISTLEQMAINGIGGINSESLQQILKETNKNRDQIRKSLISESATGTYDKVLNLRGANTLTEQQMQAMAEKINSIYAKYGDEGLKEFERQIQGQHISVALEIDTTNLESGIDAQAQQILDDAKIDEKVFQLFRENTNADGKEYSDTELARALAAQDKLNNIYKDRKEIFKALEGAKIGQLTGEQQTYITDLQEALSTFTGLDLDVEDILGNLDDIQGYFDGTEDGLAAFNNFITELRKNVENTVGIRCLFFLSA